MKSIYRHTETVFEKITSVSIAIMGNPLTFIAALIAVVLFWLGNKDLYVHDLHEFIRDMIHGLTFLSLFIIQKSFNRFSATLHLKLNELVASNIEANNSVINVEQKTEHEINALSKEYDEMAEIAEQAKIADITAIEEPNDIMGFN